ncbi:hypothetical protein CEUSTIGMA_g6591.t1 [Chlamydomonas eustigma]|uniref:Succinate dehydrogenase assembly factor 2, mitochondrial n=1 Tax=Chlamydomonas eustigma TaxID=1157962 RepID=A0A250X7T3_9CHLO|nr:hypothetical protein CEUSTIGMA_g6591.t1 [Chlamydomonas eustigma]|eukprot:GAX79151.1 hypothetical protein CEUSTIGMA_g6591.t1 [Chlamydomonas eustigma]
MLRRLLHTSQCYLWRTLPISEATYSTICGLARNFSDNASEAAVVNRAGMINKLLYRSRQRGFLELDLMVGLWAEREVPRMSSDMMNHFAEILELENPDLFKWLTGQLIPPNEVSSNPAFQALKGHVQDQLGESCHASAHAPSGKDWVRGWDDSWRKQPDASSPTSVDEK